MKVSFLAVFHVAVASVDHAADVSCAADEQSLLQGVTAVRKVSEHRSDNQRPGQAHYVGCFVDDPQRDLGQIVGGSNDAATNTFAGCRAACGDSKYMSLQYGGECFCADSYGNGAQYRQVSDSECNRNVEPCSSNSHNCGGSWRQAIYEINFSGYEPAVGACRTRDGGNGRGMYSSADVDKVAQCASACDASPTCFAFEFTGVSSGNTGGELHRQPMPAATGHPNGLCYNKPAGPVFEGYQPANVGACRTRDGDAGSGTYSRADADDVAQCASACDASPTCFAFEFTGVTTGKRGNKGCELHRQPMPVGTGHTNGLCYNKL